MTTPQEVLAGVPLFSMLPKEEVAKLARRAHELRVPAGTVVTDMDKVGVSFGVIVDGQAAVSVHGQHIRVLGPGDYFGEMALIDESYRYRSATITAETELY
jgi:CRP-like cAMP-binding protein